jgi:hypothetical protein
MVATTMAASMYAEQRVGVEGVERVAGGGSECLVSSVQTRRAGGQDRCWGRRCGDKAIELLYGAAQTTAIQARGRND